MKKFIIFICVFLCLVGCSNEKPKEPEVPNPNEQKEEEPKQEEKTPVKWIADPESKTRPYAVMINCHNNALPQSDVNKAYIVYELMVEGGITITSTTIANQRFFNGNLYLAKPYPTNVQEIICKILTKSEIHNVLPSAAQ